jgi:hypothetical protein
VLRIFTRRRVRRHDDRGRNAEQAGRRGDSLGVVARGEGDHPCRALRVVELRQPVVGAAELEGAGVLQRFELEQDAAAGARVERGAVEQGGAPGMACDPSGGRLHILEGRQARDRVHGH